jgi:hypothetical protein
MVGHLRPQLFFASDEQYVNVILLGGQNGAFYLRLWGFVRPHCINRNDGGHGLGESV